MKNTIYLTISLLLVSQQVHSKDINKSLKATASMQSICSISADSINFGVIASPLVQQSATGEMSIFCNNRTNYTVGLAYGGVYGKAPVSPGYWRLTNRDSYDAYNYWEYSRYNSSGAYITKQTVYYYGYGGVPTSTIESTLGCTLSGTTCNIPGITYDYGLMKGMAKNDNVAYSFFVPNQPTKVWNTGNSTYTGTGVGSVQTIPVLVKIVPNKSSSKYPAPDIYNDIITATINY